MLFRANKEMASFFGAGPSGSVSIQSQVCPAVRIGCDVMSWQNQHDRLRSVYNRIRSLGGLLLGVWSGSGLWLGLVFRLR